MARACSFRRRIGPWWRAAGLLLARVGTVASETLGAEPGAALEYKVKAGYLYNFAKLVEWPAATATATAQLVLGVLDDGEALPTIRAQLEGKAVNGRTVAVRAVRAGHIPPDLHILLVTRAAGVAPEEARARLGVAPTLLVGETEKFAEHGGMVGFVREGETIRLALNLERAAGAGLKISAKLASVARLVKTAPGRNGPSQE